MEDVKHKRDNSRSVLAIVLIVIGVLWLLRKMGFYFEFPRVFWENIYFPFRHFFQNWGHIFISWPMILIIVGVILMAGRRSAGLILLVIGAVFLIPRIFFLHGITITLLFPVLLIGIGVAIGCTNDLVRGKV